MNMGRALMGIITGGVWLMATNPPSSGLERRLGKGRIKFETFNVPSRAKALKVLQSRLCKGEIESVLDLIERRSWFYVKDGEVFESIADDFEKAGFPVLESDYKHYADPEYGYFYHPQVMNLETGELSDLRRFNQCLTPGCHGDGTMILDFGGASACHYCGSTNVIDSASLSDQEFDKHVKKLSKARPRAASPEANQEIGTLGDLLRSQSAGPTAEDIVKVRRGGLF